MTFAHYIALSDILLFVMVLFAGIVVKKGWTPAGMMAMFGNRESGEALSGFAGRADRAANNMIENMVLFGAASIAALAAGNTDGTAVTGAAIFFWARLFYWPVYLAGIPFLRTLIWLVSLVGIARILQAAFGG